MNEKIRYPLLLLVTLVGSTFFHIAGASPAQTARYYQPSYLPVMPTGNTVGYTPGYRFRPIERQGVSNRYGSPAIPRFGGYYGLAVAALYAYPPQFRPARFNRPHFADRHSWRTAGYSFPQTSYLQINYSRYSPGYSQGGWRRPPALAANPAFMQRGYGQPRRAPGQGLVWSGRQSNYHGSFRPLPANPVTPPGRLAANWGRLPPVYQRHVLQPRFAPVFSPKPQQTPVGLAYSVPAYRGSRKIADNRPYSVSKSLGYTPVAKRFILSRNWKRPANRIYRQEKMTVSPFPSYTGSFPVTNAGNIRSWIRHYQFRPDNRIAESRVLIRAEDIEYSPHKKHADESMPTPSIDYRFRPDSRFSGTFSAVPRRFLPIFPTSPEPETVGYIPDELRMISVKGMRVLPLDLIDSFDAVDPPDISALDLDLLRFKKIDRFGSIVAYTIGR